MGKIDEQKEKISTFRTLLAIFITALFSDVGFLFLHYERLNIFQQLIIAIATVSLVMGILLFALLLKKEIEKLRDM